MVILQFIMKHGNLQDFERQMPKSWGQVDPEVGGAVVFHSYFSTNDPWQFHNLKS